MVLKEILTKRLAYLKSNVQTNTELSDEEVNKIVTEIISNDEFTQMIQFCVVRNLNTIGIKTSLPKGDVSIKFQNFSVENDKSIVLQALQFVVASYDSLLTTEVLPEPSDERAEKTSE